MRESSPFRVASEATHARKRISSCVPLARNFSLHPPNGKLARRLFLCEYYIDVTPRAGTNKVQSNPVNTDTERAIESVPVKRGVRIKLVEFKVARLDFFRAIPPKFEH